MRRLVGLFLLLVLVLAEIHDSADARPFVGRDLDQIEIGLASFGDSLIDRQNSELFTSRSNDSHRRNANLFIDPSRNPLSDWSGPFLLENKSPLPDERFAGAFVCKHPKTNA